MSVSIIIPVYNTERFLRRCLDSVLKQTFSDWTATVVNDGSTDSSGEIAEGYARLDSRFRVIHKKNQGEFLARLDGIAATNGEIIMFLDSDDYWSSDCVYKVVRAFRENLSDIVIFRANVIDENGNTRFSVGGNFGQEGPLDKLEVCRILATSHDRNSMCLKAFKRAASDLEMLHRPLGEKGRIGEDKMMLLPIVSAAEKIYYLDEELYIYSYFIGSVSHLFDVNRIDAMLGEDMFSLTRKYITLWNIDTKEIRRAFGAYYIRHLMSCYYKIRKICKDKQARAQFRAYPWSKKISHGSINYLFGKDLTIREKIKLLSMMISVR